MDFFFFSTLEKKSSFNCPPGRFLSRRISSAYTIDGSKDQIFFECISLTNSHDNIVYLLWGLKWGFFLFCRRSTLETQVFIEKTFHLKVFKWTADIDSVEFWKFSYTSVLKTCSEMRYELTLEKCAINYPKNYAFSTNMCCVNSLGWKPIKFQEFVPEWRH